MLQARVCTRMYVGLCALVALTTHINDTKTRYKNKHPLARKRKRMRKRMLVFVSLLTHNVSDKIASALWNKLKRSSNAASSHIFTNTMRVECLAVTPVRVTISVAWVDTSHVRRAPGYCIQKCIHERSILYSEMYSWALYFVSIVRSSRSISHFLIDS